MILAYDFTYKVQTVYKTNATKHPHWSILEMLLSGLGQGITAMRKVTRFECGYSE